MNRMYNAMGAALLGASMLAGPAQAQQGIEGKVAKLEFEVTIRDKEPYGNVNGKPAVRYYFDLVLKGGGGVSVDFEKVTRYLSSGLLEESDKERGTSWISGKCGSTHLDYNSKCFMSKRWFFSTEKDDLFSETWHLKDANGNKVSKEYRIPTSAYSK